MIINRCHARTDYKNDQTLMGLMGPLGLLRVAQRYTREPTDVLLTVNSVGCRMGRHPRRCELGLSLKVIHELSVQMMYRLPCQPLTRHSPLHQVLLGGPYSAPHNLDDWARRVIEPSQSRTEDLRRGSGPSSHPVRIRCSSTRWRTRLPLHRLFHGWCRGRRCR